MEYASGLIINVLRSASPAINNPKFGTPQEADFYASLKRETSRPRLRKPQTSFGQRSSSLSNQNLIAHGKKFETIITGGNPSSKKQKKVLTSRRQSAGYRPGRITDHSDNVSVSPLNSSSAPYQRATLLNQATDQKFSLKEIRRIESANFIPSATQITQVNATSLNKDMNQVLGEKPNSRYQPQKNAQRPLSSGQNSKKLDADHHQYVVVINAPRFDGQKSNSPSQSSVTNQQTEYIGNLTDHRSSQYNNYRKCAIHEHKLPSGVQYHEYLNKPQLFSEIAQPKVNIQRPQTSQAVYHKSLIPRSSQRPLKQKKSNGKLKQDLEFRQFVQFSDPYHAYQTQSPLRAASSQRQLVKHKSPISHYPKKDPQIRQQQFYLSGSPPVIMAAKAKKVQNCSTGTEINHLDPLVEVQAKEQLRQVSQRYLVVGNIGVPKIVMEDLEESSRQLIEPRQRFTSQTESLLPLNLSQNKVISQRELKSQAGASEAQELYSFAAQTPRLPFSLPQEQSFYHDQQMMFYKLDLGNEVTKQDHLAYTETETAKALYNQIAEQPVHCESPKVQTQASNSNHLSSLISVDSITWPMPKKQPEPLKPSTDYTNNFGQTNLALSTRQTPIAKTKLTVPVLNPYVKFTAGLREERYQQMKQNQINLAIIGSLDKRHKDKAMDNNKINRKIQVQISKQIRQKPRTLQEFKIAQHSKLRGENLLLSSAGIAS